MEKKEKENKSPATLYASVHGSSNSPYFAWGDLKINLPQARRGETRRALRVRVICERHTLEGGNCKREQASGNFLLSGRKWGNGENGCATCRKRGEMWCNIHNCLDEGKNGCGGRRVAGRRGGSTARSRAAPPQHRSLLFWSLLLSSYAG